MEKSGITVDCQHCVFTQGDAQGHFDVAVPIADKQSGLSGIARLQCTVSSANHQVSLSDWRAGQHAISETVSRRLAEALKFVADKRICGSRKLCPVEVVRIVEKVGAR
ncbi:MAG: hypothetical protein PVG66_00225 [Chromatiales bacterium]